MDSDSEFKNGMGVKVYRSRRECYYNLFRIYSELNFDALMRVYTKIYNDVFIREKPLIIQKYHVSEIKILELYETKQ